MIQTFPNFLTTLRLLAAPFMILVFWIFPRPQADIIAFIVFVLASLTDFLDGYLARKWQQVTAYGAMMDPIADKAMVVVTLLVVVVFANWNVLLLLPAILIIFREAAVFSLREYLGDFANLLKVTGNAKLKTTLQMVALILLFLAQILRALPDSPYGAVPEFILFWGGMICLWIAAFLTVTTGVDYFHKAMPYLKRDAKP